MRRLVPGILVTLLGAWAAHAASAESDDNRPRFKNIHVIDYHGEVDPMLRVYLDRRIGTAIEAGADCIVFRIDSPGGRVDQAREIGDRIFRIPERIHTIAWVPRMAMSAAAHTSLACDEIVMGAEASLGDSQPILATTGKPEPVGEKIESPLRAWFRNYAQKNGYPPLLAEAMVSESLEVIRVLDEATGRHYFVNGIAYRNAQPEDLLLPEQGLRREDVVQVGQPIVASGQLLTMTPEEAYDLGFVSRMFGATSIPKSEEALLNVLRADESQVTFHEMSFSERAGRVLLTIAGILSAVVALSLMFLLWQGPGVLTIVGGAALVVSLIIYGTVEHLHGFPLFLIFLGIALFAVEVFIIPGFGVAGILGLASMGTGFMFLAIGTTIGDDTPRLTQDNVVGFGLQFVATAIIGFLILFTFSRFFPKVGPAKRMVLATPDGSSGADVDASALPSVNSVGTAVSDLRPGGTVEIGGEAVSAVSTEGFVAAGTAVRVTGSEGNEVTVRPVEDATS